VVKNFFKSRILATGFLSILVYFGVASAEVASEGDEQPSTVVAEAGSHKITAGQLAQDAPDALNRARSKILQARIDYYQAEHSALEKEIEKDLLDQEAEKEHVSVDELLKRHTSGKVKDPSEETVRIYYLATQSRDSYAEMRPKIIASIRSLEENKARAEYMESLRANQNIRVTLVPPTEEVAVGDLPAMGPQNAAVTVVEFADYQCPYCRQIEPAMEKLRAQYKDKVRYSYRDFPLPMHQFAQKAAEASRCAGVQGQFWPYHDRIFTADSNLDTPKLKSIAKDLKLDSAAFDKCLDSGQQADAVAKDSKDGKNLGITGTPTVFVNGHVISGAASYETLRELVDGQIAAAGQHSSNTASSAALSREVSPHAKPNG